MKSDFYKIALPVQQVLTTLIAEAKEINGSIIVKSLHQQQPANLPDIDKTELLEVPAFKAEVISQIERQLSAKKSLMRKFQ